MSAFGSVMWGILCFVLRGSIWRLKQALVGVVLEVGKEKSGRFEVCWRWVSVGAGLTWCVSVCEAGQFKPCRCVFLGGR